MLNPIYVKRLVGLPGETVAIFDNRLWVNGRLVSDPPFFETQYYTNECAKELFTEEILGEDECLLFGDNTLSSADSRKWGPAPLENLKGRAFFRYWPPRHIGFPK